MSNLLNERILLIYQHLSNNFKTDAIATLNSYDKTQDSNTLEFSINGKLVSIKITQAELLADEDAFNLVLDRFIADAESQL